MIDDLLVGIEWEPQLTLEEYPQKKVFVFEPYHLDKTATCGVDDCFGEKVVSLCPFYGSKKYSRISYDMPVHNLEVRTNPVTLRELPDEIAECQKQLAEFVIDLAKDVGGVGVFLPRSERKKMRDRRYLNISKHLNLSVDIERYTPTFPKRDVDLEEGIQIKASDPGYPSSHRLHLKIPYRTVLNEQMILWLFEEPRRIWELPEDDEKPYLLGWSRGSRFNKCKSLA